MNIVFLTTLNPYDINNWSGTTFHLLQALRKKHNVKVIGLNTLSQTAYYIKNNFSKTHSFDNYAPLFGRFYGEQISDSDLIFFGDLYLAPFLDVNIPMVHLSDVTYHCFKDYLNHKKSKEQNNRIESLEKQLLNEKYTTIIYSSEWTKQNTIDYYGIDSSKIHVVEFGANIPSPKDYNINIQMDICNLVFIGRNWMKKGGNKALGAYKKLKSEGFSCALTIVGSTPSEMSDREDRDLTIIPFLDKSKPEHLNRLCSILKDAHFLVLPTEFDAFGIVFCEASAYGVPSIAADVGGVSQPVREGKNGFLLPPNATAEDYAEKIKSVFSDKEKYIELRKSSRQEYETRLNWAVWGEKVNKILEERVENYKKSANNKDKMKLAEYADEQTSTSESDFYLPVYVINLKDRTERRKHIEKQFHGKPEFELTWVEAVEHPIGAVGLWQSMVKAVEMAEANEDDIMIICEDDHTFTSAYSKEYLLANIIEADEQGSELLSGGIGGFGLSAPVAANRYWIDWFWCTQFIVIFNPLFQKMLDYEFKDTDTADGVLSVLAKDKMTVYPFISIQKDFGYSDVTRTNNEISGMITNHFRQTDMRLSIIHSIAHKFRQKINDRQ